MPRTRNHYEPAGGVLSLRWTEGHPPATEYGPFLVEVWTPTLNFWNRVPGIRLNARFEVWVRNEGTLYSIDAQGNRHPVPSATLERARRWTVLRGARWWDANVTLDKWGTA